MRDERPWRASALPLQPTRRRFVQGLAAGGVALGLPAWAATASAPALARKAPELRGTQFDLVVDQAPVNFTGQLQMATTVNGSLPAPTLRAREGDTVTIRVTNRLRETTSIHWHGIILPYNMDGVPGLSFTGIAPGETFTYQFTLQQSGTYWYHSHSGMQELTGMYGALIVEPRGGERIRADREHVMLLSDWTGDDPMRAFKMLKAQSDVFNVNRPTAGDFMRDASAMGTRAALDKRAMWNDMRMNPTDLADLSSVVLTYLTNGVTPAGNWTGLFKRGERVRLRFINGAGNTFYDVRIPGLKLTVVQADGTDVEPVTVDEFRFGPGQTCDVLVQPQDDAYTVFAQSMDRTGYARGTLAVREGLQAPVPALDPVQWLDMGDMMGDMSGMDHGSMPGMNHGSAPGMGQGAMTGMNHGGMAGMNHGNMLGMGQGAMAGMNHSGMSGMNHGSMPGMGQGAMAGMNHGGMAGMSHGGMDHSAHADPLQRPSQTVRHARSEFGPSTDMRVDTPRTNLDDPGVGLRGNGRRVLTLADLHTIGGPLDPRGAEREIELHLTGNMERYTWSFDGLEFGQSTPVHLRFGERVRVILQNDTMMTHPMHMHGLWSELETPQGEFQARLHTIPVQPAQRLSFLVTADALGRWAWHCHLMFHMEAGMFREVVVS